MNRRDYRKIAKKYGVSVSEVKKDMQEAINAAYQNPTLYANCVPRKDEIPTVDEFISYASNRVEIIEKNKEKDEE